jgi:nucleotide-binding universal stress UspA family protein
MGLSLIEAQEQAAKAQMQRIEAALKCVTQEAILVHGAAVWPVVEDAIEKCEIDLVILGTRGRTGGTKYLLGSVAEEIFRRSPVPVMTIGPAVRGNGANHARFSRVLFATDFTPESLTAAPYATFFAQEHESRLILLHVIGEHETGRTRKRGRLSVAEAIHQLCEIVPPEAELWHRPEPVVDHGEPAARILETANERLADLIVLGIRDTSHLLAAAHLQTSTAHKIVARALCPVLTVRKKSESKTVN